jgi:undecaprenyl-diphosphatase
VDVVLLGKAAVMGVVEGLTEFLPISSTGHLILTGALLGFEGETAKVFDIAIQTGAIFAVIWVFWQRLQDTTRGLIRREPLAMRFTAKVLTAFFPAVVLGLAFGKAVKAHLFTPQVVATTFILGGFAILWIESRVAKSSHAVRVASVDDMSLADALRVGLLQCLALVPGTSRSGATIMGGMWLGLSRTAATEFSFYLAIPTLIGAGVYSLYKARSVLAWSDLPLFAVGLVMAFVSAWVCVRWLLRFVSTHSFVPFAYYRIAFGGLVLLTHDLGWINWSE